MGTLRNVSMKWTTTTSRIAIKGTQDSAKYLRLFSASFSQSVIRTNSFRSVAKKGA